MSSCKEVHSWWTSEFGSVRKHPLDILLEVGGCFEYWHLEFREEACIRDISLGNISF